MITEGIARRDAFKLLIMSTVITMALWFIPFANWLTYPFRLFVTIVHESSHAIAALLTFGSVNRIALSVSGSGVTQVVGGLSLIVSSAGYVGTTIYGALLLLLVRQGKFSRAAAMVTALLLLAVTLLFAGNLLMWISGLGFAIGFLLLSLKAGSKFVQFFMSFLAIQCLLNAFYDLWYLLYLSISSPSVQTDAQNMAAATNGLIPAVIWALAWALISLLVILATLTVFYRDLRARALI